MGQHPGMEAFHLLFRLFPGHLARVVNQKPNDLGVVDVAIPKLLRKLSIAADLFGQLPQLRQANAKALLISIMLVMN